MSTIAVDEIERGDVLLVTRRPHDDFADLIIALDGAPAEFSHSGVALGDGRILSAYPTDHPLRSLLARPTALDLGGLHADDFGHFWDLGQSIHRVAVDAPERARVADDLDRYSLGPGSFSMPKVVVVAATLHALAPSNPIPSSASARIVRRAIALAQAWADDGDFYCAEFVAHLYGWRFTLADLVPPRWRRRPEVPRLARLWIDVVAPVLSAGHTADQRDTMYAFIDEVRRSDPTFFGPRPWETIMLVVDGLGDRVGLDRNLDDWHEPVDDSPLDPETPLPSALVTPRMLRRRHPGAATPPRVVVPGEELTRR